MNDKIRKANKGEWSEFYTLLKILDEQKLYAADEHLEKLKDIFYPVLKVITAKDSDRELTYEFDNREDIKFYNPKTASVTFVKRSAIKERVAKIFDEIKSADVSTFEIPLAETILEELGNPVIKGYSTKKSDITLVLHDIRTGVSPEVGFSIKSQIGGASTLLNSGKPTNFIYEIENFSGSLEAINAIDTHSKVRDRIKAILDMGGSLKFIGVQSKVFEENLTKIDSLLPALIGQMLLIYYTGVAGLIPEVNQYLESNNFSLIPGLNPKSGFYEFKIKHFLMNTALGMTPAREWDGLLQTHGGYIVVREDGEIVCYHLYNQDAFRDYLYSHTRLDTPSTTRYEFGNIYKEEGKYFIKLNLQIRFTD
jgi:type II restriction enzyme